MKLQSKKVVKSIALLSKKCLVSSFLKLSLSYVLAVLYSGRICRGSLFNLLTYLLLSIWIHAGNQFHQYMYLYNYYIVLRHAKHPWLGEVELFCILAFVFFSFLPMFLCYFHLFPDVYDVCGIVASHWLLFYVHSQNILLRCWCLLQTSFCFSRLVFVTRFNGMCVCLCGYFFYRSFSV